MQSTILAVALAAATASTAPAIAADGEMATAAILMNLAHQECPDGAGITDEQLVSMVIFAASERQEEMQLTAMYAAAGAILMKGKVDAGIGIDRFCTMATEIVAKNLGGGQ